MNKYSIFIAISKDGFIATKDGSINFLNNLKNINGDGGYSSYYKSVDALVYGSKTYEKILSFNLEKWPYENKKQIVLTSDANKYIPQENIIFSSQTLEDIDLYFDNKHIWVMGGANIIDQYLKVDLIQEMYICKANIILEDGIKLFKNKEEILKKFNFIGIDDYGDIKIYKYQRKI